MKGKDLYGIILSHYDIFKPYIDAKATHMEICNRIKTASNEDNKTRCQLPILRTEYGNVGIVDILYPYQQIKSNGYISFSIFSTSVAYELQKYIKLYKQDSCGNCSNFLCHISDQHILFEKFLPYIYDIDAPRASIRSDFLESYINANNNVLSVYCYRTLICYRELEKHTIWGLNRLYESIIWTFELVEKYKENIDWKKLVELSNLEWDIEKVKKYHKYIPLIIKDKEYYNERFNAEKVVRNFSKFVISENTFILDNIDNIAITDFLKTAKFTLSPGDISAIRGKLSKIKGYWDRSELGCTSEILSYDLYISFRKNKNIKWTPALLHELGDECETFQELSREERVKLIPIFEEAFKQYSDLSKMLNCQLFLARLKEGEQKHNAYSIFFTPQSITSNLNKWNEFIIDGAYSHTHRLSRDTYYYVYIVRTMWNYFNENKELNLNYELCKVLSNLSITVGGEYEKEYEHQTYYDDGFHSKNINALEYFAHHKFCNEEEIEKLFSDELLFIRMLEYKNESIIRYCIESFFGDYPLEKFLTVLKNLGIGCNK